jgi:predicted dehydrogenase
MSSDRLSPAITRRAALQAGALGALSLMHEARSAAAPATPAVRIAQVGVGNQGLYDLRAIATAPQAKIVALCDVDLRYLDAASQEFGEARTFRDYRKLLAEMGAAVDAVVVSTPDHMHAAVALAAMSAGKHVYLQKPLAHNLAELRQLVKVAADKGVVTQMLGEQRLGRSVRAGRRRRGSGPRGLRLGIVARRGPAAAVRPRPLSP